MHYFCSTAAMQVDHRGIGSILPTTHESHIVDQFHPVGFIMPS